MRFYARRPTTEVTTLLPPSLLLIVFLWTMSRWTLPQQAPPPERGVPSQEEVLTPG